MADPFANLSAPHADAEQFDAVVESVGPDSVFVVIERWMGPALKARHAVEDVWQEVLIHAWRDRDRHGWQGIKSYRSWLLSIAKNRIHDLVDHDAAQKRGGGQVASFSSLERSGADGGLSALLPGRSTTPSRIASHRERAALMQKALSELEPADEEVVRGHLFEERPMQEISTALGVPESTAWSRFRKGAAEYARRLTVLEALSRTRG